MKKIRYHIQHQIFWFTYLPHLKKIPFIAIDKSTEDKIVYIIGYDYRISGHRCPHFSTLDTKFADGQTRANLNTYLKVGDIEIKTCSFKHNYFSSIVKKAWNLGLGSAVDSSN